MLRRIRSRLTYANVMATIAVFIALGGTSYAALQITGRNVPQDALTGADIKDLTGKDVRNGSLLAQDFKAGQLPKGSKGDPGARGDPGAKGDPADAGAPAAAAVLNLSTETCAAAAGKILHADYELYDTAAMHSTDSNTENL